MKRLLAAATAAMLGLSACGGSHATAPPIPKSVSAQKHVRHLKTDKLQKDLLGGVLRIKVALVAGSGVLLRDHRRAPAAASVNAQLTGADAANSKFNAGIIGVDAIDTNDNSWQLVAYPAPQVVDLFTLQSDSLDLGNGTLPGGTYPSMQLLLDPETTTVTYNGQAYPVVFVDSNHPWWDPTRTVQAVNIPVTVSGSAGDSIDATLDFNIFQSASLSNGVVYLTPTVTGGVASPTINGTLANTAGGPVSNATVIATDATGNVANTALSAADGSFHLRGINPGGYTITVANTFTTNAGVTITASGADPGAAPSTYVVVGPNSQVSLGTISD